MQEIWHQAQSNIEKFLSPQTFKTWIEPIAFGDSKNDSIILEVPNKFFKEYLKDNYIPIIREALAALLSQPVKIEFRINQSLPDRSETETAAPAAKTRTKGNSHQDNLNPKYTFDTFVCGSSNQFAHAASQAVASRPASSYNPLFIYGGVGLGKTHLLIAIGNEVLQNNKNARVCYYTSEKFMNELINCLRYQKMEQFKDKFRNMDVLLIDDIQFIAGKDRTQEEFFHTFNALYESHKQIVITSDRFPKDIPGLEERLRSRFEWGLIADIQAPDIETKVAILKKKAELDRINLPDDVAMFLASSSSTNVRELEGMLIRLGAFSSLTRSGIHLEMAKDVLKDIIVEKTRELTIEMIQKCVTDHFKIKPAELKSTKKLKTIVFPRQIAIYLCRELTKASYPQIGDRFGGKDHSTIIHSVKKIEKQLGHDLDLKATMDQLRKTLLS